MTNMMKLIKYCLIIMKELKLKATPKFEQNMFMIQNQLMAHSW